MYKSFLYIYSAFCRYCKIRSVIGSRSGPNKGILILALTLPIKRVTVFVVLLVYMSILCLLSVYYLLPGKFTCQYFAFFLCIICCLVSLHVDTSPSFCVSS